MVDITMAIAAAISPMIVVSKAVRSEDDSVMVTVTRMATDADKDATIVDPQVVGYVTKIQ